MIKNTFSNYDHLKIEAKWQKFWDDNHTFKVKVDYTKPKYYVLDMFPYPSGAGLHVGHPEGYTATDIIARLKRKQGFNVLHPMGWDAFGLPAENYAIKTGTHPRISTDANIATFKRQIKALGFSYDWDREIDTTDPNYFKWSQWIFLQLFKHGLAYEKEMLMAWCPKCKIVVANEEVENGVHERCETEVEKRTTKQWLLKITAYADRLLADLETLDWHDKIKSMQSNWIGKSYGAEVDFSLSNAEKIRVYTTRPDTLFGCTYMVLAPEHSLVKTCITADHKNEVENYIKKSLIKSERERKQDEKEKTGVFTGSYAINPVNKSKVPIWVADYVLADYGTGAIMAVPAHDERDYEFAKKFNLPIKHVIKPITKLDDKINIRTPLDDEFLKITEIIKQENLLASEVKLAEFKVLLVNNNLAGFARETVIDNQYQIGAIYVLPEFRGQKLAEKIIKHIIDNSVADELYLHCGTGVCDYYLDIGFKKIETKSCGCKCKTNTVNSFKYTKSVFPENGIVINSDFINDFQVAEAKNKMIDYLVKNNLGERKTNYKLRDWIFTRQRYWGEPIPLVHCDKCGVVPIPESELPLKLPEVAKYEPSESGESPLANITDWINTVCPKCGGKSSRETSTMPNWAGSSWYWLRFMDSKNDQSMLNNEIEEYWQQVDLYVGGAEHAVLHLLYARFWHKFLYDIKVVSTIEPFQKLVNQGMILAEDGSKMSKSKGNVINPDDVVREYGADTLRLYEMFMGPFDQTVLWSTKGVAGVRKFLDRVWRLREKVNFSDKKAILIHGWGGTCNNHWFPELKEQLIQKGYYVQTPSMPNTDKPVYAEWKAVLDQLEINENTVLVGHSLGGGFIPRYLSDTGKKVAKIILVAPSNYNFDYVQNPATIKAVKLMIDKEFNKIYQAEKVKALVNDVVVIHSDNDEFIGQNDFNEYTKSLQAKTVIIKGGQHLNGIKTPEVLKNILEYFPIKNEITTLHRTLHKTIKKVVADTENFKFNTAISAMMVLVNEMVAEEKIPVNFFEDLLFLLNSYAPHLTEELWQSLGHLSSLTYKPLPIYHEDLCKDEKMIIAIQINGKLRDELEFELTATKEEILQQAKNSPKVQKHLIGEIKKEIYVPGKLVSLVV